MPCWRKGKRPALKLFGAAVPVVSASWPATFVDELLAPEPLVCGGINDLADAQSHRSDRCCNNRRPESVADGSPGAARAQGQLEQVEISEVTSM